MKARITIKGSRVQDVGYRLFLLSRARNLRGFEAENVGEDLVVLVEGDEVSVGRFTEVVKAEKPPLAEVDEVVVEGYDGEVMDVKEYREQLSLEQLAKIATVGVEIRDDVKEMKADIKEMKADIKEMKTDIKEMKTDVGTILKKQDETIAEIKALREDLKQYMDRRLEKLEREIVLIKQKIGLA